MTKRYNEVYQLRMSLVDMVSGRDNPEPYSGSSCNNNYNKMSAPMEKTKEGGDKDKKKDDDAELDALLDSEISYRRAYFMY